MRESFQGLPPWICSEFYQVTIYKDTHEQAREGEIPYVDLWSTTSDAMGFANCSLSLPGQSIWKSAIYLHRSHSHWGSTAELDGTNPMPLW